MRFGHQSRQMMPVFGIYDDERSSKCTNDAQFRIPMTMSGHQSEEMMPISGFYDDERSPKSTNFPFWSLSQNDCYSKHLYSKLLTYNVFTKMLAIITEATVTVVKPAISIGGDNSFNRACCSSSVRPTLRLTSWHKI